MRSLCFAFIAFYSISSSLLAQNWPEFRGPTGDGISTVKSAPTTWHEKEEIEKASGDTDSNKKKEAINKEKRESENIAWKVPIPGRGWSSPVVWEDQVWLVTAPDDGKETRAMCVDLVSGKVVHDLKLWDVPKPQEKHAFNSYASCTPAIEKGRIYVHFGSHGTACLDTATGVEIWRRGPDDPELQADHLRGPGSSVVIYNEKIFLTYDGVDRQFIVALNKKTGETIWKTDRNFVYPRDTGDGDWKKSYSTPQVIRVDGREQLISPSSSMIAAYDPTNGKEIWRAETGGMNAAARPIFKNGLIYASSFTEGLLYYALKPTRSGIITDQIAWKQSRGAPRRCGAMVLDNRVYIMSDDGVLCALDGVTGKVIWTERLGGSYAASPVFAAGRIYFFDIEGRGTVIEPGDKFKKIAINRLNIGCMGSPAVVEGALIVRTKDALYRIGK